MKKITWHAEKRKTADLIPADYNPRAMDAKEKDDLSRSVDDFGTAIPLVINTGKRNNTLIGGHQRRTIYLEKGIDEIEVMVPDRELTLKEEKTLNLRLNKNTGHFDKAMLPDFGQEILLEVGFESQIVDGLFEDDEDEEDEYNFDEEVEKIVTPIAKRGDVYELGESRLMCGDSTSASDMLTLMNGQLADMVFTDPPYNMNYKSHTKGGILNDHMEDTAFVEFSEAFILQLKECCKVGAPYYICSGYNSYVPFRYALEAVGLNFSGVIVWAKNSLGMGMNDYRHQHELILKAKKEVKEKKKKAGTMIYGWNGGRHFFSGGHDEADVWNLSRRGSNSMCHPTQKPIPLVNRAIRNSSKHGEIVLDLFGGSGSTLISAVKTGRKAYICEMDEKYVDTIIKRWESLTNQKAIKINK